MSRIYLSPPDVGEAERELLLQAFDSGWIAPLGPHVDGFEREMADYVGVGHAAALNSGTAALHLALAVLGVRPGSAVLTSTLTFAATANAITYVGARPVFIDSAADTWNMDPALLADELHARVRAGDRPAAVIAVDLYGQCPDYDPIRAACAEYGVPLVEDAAEALGANYQGRRAGSLGDLAIFSFNGNKIITTSGGGMLLSDREELVARARFLATQARDPAPHYQHSTVGFNYRLSNLLAAVGRAQLAGLERRVERRRAINRRYRRLLEGTPGLAFMPEAPFGRSTCWLTCLTVDPAVFGADRERIRLALEAEDIEARPVWKPMHLQPVFADCDARLNGVADRLFERGICLPSGSTLTDAQVDRIAGLVLEQRRG